MKTISRFYPKLAVCALISQLQNSKSFQAIKKRKVERKEQENEDKRVEETKC